MTCTIVLLSAVPHEKSQVLNQGHIFLNCSLTESFVSQYWRQRRAVYIVSTAVGGLPEVLPSNMITLSKRVNSEI